MASDDKLEVVRERVYIPINPLHNQFIGQVRKESGYWYISLQEERTQYSNFYKDVAFTNRADAKQALKMLYAEVSGQGYY